MRTCISNPPFNIRWKEPFFAQMQPRFSHTVVPPEQNANYAFVLTAIESADRCVMILPQSVLTSSVEQENAIRRYLVESNLLDAIIVCPENMFESTSIPVCVLVLDKHRETTNIALVDLSFGYDEEEREQKGQFGNAVARTYKKKVSVFGDDLIRDVVALIRGKKPGEHVRIASRKELQDAGYKFLTGLFALKPEEERKSRPLDVIVSDLNTVIAEKNSMKLTVNVTVAKALGLDASLYKQKVDFSDLNILLKRECGKEIQNEDYVSITKNKLEFRLENRSTKTIPQPFLTAFRLWKEWVIYLNNRENVYLAELRDALLPMLMAGSIDVSSVGGSDG